MADAHYIYVRAGADPAKSSPTPFLLARTPKCGSTYMQYVSETVVPGCKFLRPRDAYPKRIGGKRPPMPCHIFVREPMDRLVSAWNYFKRAEDPGGAGTHTVEWEFEDYLAKNVLLQGNSHWIPQVEQHLYKDIFMPTIAWRLDDFDLIKPQLFPGGNMGDGGDRRNHKPHPDYVSFDIHAELDELVRTKYAEDTRLYAAIPPGKSISVSNWPVIG